jgi:hypothetical protein
MPNQRKQTPQYARAQFVSASLNEESRTVDVVFATPTPVLRYSWYREEYYNEVLDMDGANLERASKGLPVLDNHNSYGSVRNAVIGRAENIRRDGDQWVATVRFSKRDDVQQIVDDVRDGILTDISFGYSMDEVVRMEKQEGEKHRTYKVKRWTPSEISFVNIPADPRAGVRSGDGNEGADLMQLIPDEDGNRAQEGNENSNSNTNGQIMKREQIIAMLAKRGIVVDETISDEALNAELERALTSQGEDPEAVRNAAIQAERKRVADITGAVRSAKLKPEFAEQLISEGKTIDEARAAIIAKFAEEDTNAGRSNINTQVVADEKDKVRKAMGDALVLRATPNAAREMKAEDVNAAREFRGMSLLRMAEDTLVRDGVNTRGMSAREIAQEALGLGQRAYHSTSDFPILLGETFNRTLRAAYSLNPRTFEPFTRRTSISDFRTISRAQLSGLVGNFDEVIEGGEYKAGTMEEAKESYKLAKYGRKIGITWESIINDDLGAFNRIPQAFAAKAAQKQSDIVYGILLNNPVMGDNNPLFHNPSHGNYTSTGTALSEGSLDTAYQKFRVQKSIEGDFLNLSPRFLIVGPKNERLAYKLTSTNFTPATQADVPVPSITSLQVIVEPRITDHAWFLSAGPEQIDTIETAFLDGEQELFTEQKVGFDVDGIEIKARMVFAAKAIDWRGLYKNVGAAPAN